MNLFREAAAAASVLRRALEGRKAQARWVRFEESRGSLEDQRYSAVVHYADGLVNMYQLEQWYEPLRRLTETHPVAIVTRNVQSALHLSESSPLPVHFLPYIADVEEFMSRQNIGAVFYLNQNTRNFQMMRFREPAHVFLSHGESEKDYMASNQLKAYDYTFIAGDAARDRLRGKLIGYDVDSRTREIGRPQVDVHVAPPVSLPDDDRTVVLYAPTWEGDRPSMTYSSLVSHAPAMLTRLVATGAHRVIYRPHPRTGIADPSYRRKHGQIVALLEQANRADASAKHIVDAASTFGWQLDAADACIADISAVAFDWLATGKPIVLTLPANPQASVDEDGIASTLVGVPAAGAADIIAHLAAADDPERIARRSELVRYYFGDVTPGASMTRWLDAAKATIAARIATT